jgi:hypothetical protein
MAAAEFAPGDGGENSDCVQPPNAAANTQPPRTHGRRPA